MVGVIHIRRFILWVISLTFFVNCKSIGESQDKSGCEVEIRIVKEMGQRIQMVDYSVYNFVYKEKDKQMDSTAMVQERVEFNYLIDNLVSRESNCISINDLEKYLGTATHINEFENGINYFYRFNSLQNKDCFEAKTFGGDILDYEDCSLIRFTFDKKGKLLDMFNSFN